MRMDVDGKRRRMATTSTKPRPTRKAAAPRRGSSTNATAYLIDDHRAVEQLFTTFEGLGERALKRRGSVVDKIVTALSRHAAIEETTFYPAVRDRLPDATDDVLEALEEHHIVKWTLSELASMAPDDERFTAKVTVLIENVRHHVKEEERELFPKVRKAFTRAELETLGAELAAAARTAPTKPHPRSPDTPPANLVASALTAPIDAATTLVGAAAGKLRDAVT
jgi:hemerythrin superfamily protein